jgi:ABC-type transport system involved in cytochrome c biogenesis permease component
MTFLPIVARELRVAARRRSTYVTRTLLGLAVIAVWLIMLATARRGIAASEVGGMLFGILGTLAAAFSLLAGIFLTADCLSEERREGTLGLLFLTELRGYDVVLGKLMATSLPAVYGLLTIFPVLGLPLLIGGVSLAEFWRVVLVLLVTLAFSLSIGLAVSAFCRETRQAMSLTLLMLIVVSAVLPLVGWLRSDWLGAKTVPRPYLWPSPGYLFARAFDSSYSWTRNGRVEFWGSFATVAGIAAMGLIAANLRVPHVWQEGGEGRARRRVVGWMRRWRVGGESFRKARRRLLEQNPFYWLASRDRLSRWLVCIVSAMLALLWLYLLRGCLGPPSSSREVFFLVSIVVALGLHLILKWSVATEASRRLSEDRHSGALELVLVTPLPVGQIIEGQRRALRSSFVLPLAMASMTNVGFIWLVLRPNPLHINGSDRDVFVGLFGGGFMLLMADAYALRWVGMWMGLRARGHHRAILGTLGRILLLPWLAVLLIWLIGVGGGLNGPHEAMTIFTLWQGFGVALDLIMAYRARVALRRGLRYGIAEASTVVRQPSQN